VPDNRAVGTVPPTRVPIVVKDEVTTLEANVVPVIPEAGALTTVAAQPLVVTFPVSAGRTPQGSVPVRTDAGTVDEAVVRPAPFANMYPVRFEKMGARVKVCVCDQKLVVFVHPVLVRSEQGKVG
jgi:hypothetical protein